MSTQKYFKKIPEISVCNKMTNYLAKMPLSSLHSTTYILSKKFSFFFFSLLFNLLSLQHQTIDFNNRALLVTWVSCAETGAVWEADSSESRKPPYVNWGFRSHEKRHF